MTRDGEISVFRAERYYSLSFEDQFPEVLIRHGSMLGKPVRKMEAPLLSFEPSWRSRQLSERSMVKNELHGSQSYGDSEEEDHFAFPVLKSMIGTLEEREFSELSWDAIPKARRFLEDMESDTSSDLFEIDTLSVSGQTLTSMEESDRGSSSIAAKTGHEPDPSEVSAISAVSDGGATKTAAALMKSTAEKDLRRTKSSKLLGCRSLKAVIVVETAHRTTKIKKTKT